MVYYLIYPPPYTILITLSGIMMLSYTCIVFLHHHAHAATNKLKPFKLIYSIPTTLSVVIKMFCAILITRSDYCIATFHRYSCSWWVGVLWLQGGYRRCCAQGVYRLGTWGFMDCVGYRVYYVVDVRYTSSHCSDVPTTQPKFETTKCPGLL